MVMFESWCYAGITYGCYQDGNLLSSLEQVDLFNGSLTVEAEVNLCNVQEIPDQFTYNEWFGGGGEKSSDAPHTLKIFPDIYIVCLDTTTSTTTTSTTTTLTTTTMTTASSTMTTTTTMTSTTTVDDRIVKAAISAVVERTVGKTSCIKTKNSQNSSLETLDSTDGNNSAKLPGVDIFLNPAKEIEKTKVVEAKQGIAKAYFNSSNMAVLYPNLFRILWQSTLPCFKVNLKKN